MGKTPRRFTSEFKSQVVLQLLSKERSAVEICRQHAIKDSLLYRWKQEFLEGAPRAFGASEPGECAQLQQRIAELERLLGRLTLELDVVKKASAWRSSR